MSINQLLTILEHTAVSEKWRSHPQHGFTAEKGNLCSTGFWGSQISKHIQQLSQLSQKCGLCIPHQCGSAVEQADRQVGTA
jgi:ATP adenylyltransferase/5',5'''-P-1,P-4-tetraphosphate phosphorylase II